MDGEILAKLYADLKTSVMENLIHLHDHFSVIAACFLGFNLKKRTMPSMLAYVAKTHLRKKGA